MSKVTIKNPEALAEFIVNEIAGLDYQIGQALQQSHGIQQHIERLKAAREAWEQHLVVSDDERESDDGRESQGNPNVGEPDGDANG